MKGAVRHNAYLVVADGEDSASPSWTLRSFSVVPMWPI